MESSSSTVRRRAWINSSRQWPTVEEPDGPLCSLPSASIADDDVFSDEVLELYSENAEDTLYELGFGCEEPQVTVRIPPRFFTFPSQAQGINFRLFLDSQLRRIREEDPSLSLASRFRQVQVLTAMANAFYSLYSHVSRTPLQKLATPEFNFSSPLEKIERFRTSIRSEPRSPVERLKDTVNKMCLYTGSPRGSDSTSPQASPRKRSSLPDVVDIVLKVNTGPKKKLDLGGHARSNSDVDVRLIAGGEQMEQTQQTGASSDVHRSGDKAGQRKLKDEKQSDSGCIGEPSARGTNLDGNSVRTSLTSSLSGDTVVDTEDPLRSHQLESAPRSTQRDTKTAEPNPVAMVTYDRICPQIVESVHQAPFFCLNKHDTNSSEICSVAESIEKSCFASQKQCTQILISGPKEDVSSTGEGPQAAATGSFTAPEPESSSSHYCITVTGLEGEDGSSMSAADSSQASPVRECEGSFKKGNGQYLNPMTHPSLAHIPANRQQVNSFELEELHSAGEEDFGQSEATRTASSPLSKKHQNRGEVARVDSMQSDSSGYADEEVSPSADRHTRSWKNSETNVDSNI
ncbi:unnamed protein product [Menidia menidia]|uniref:(Atlantic silverside) hypothetical protein n=1 Tax=Menidia menidia TaxID=238744 RepID=A0A8S4BFE8_9TELE|nr:unnamed protein product [Menidia menidia]